MNWDDDSEQELIFGGEEGVRVYDRKGNDWVHKKLTDSPTGEVHDGRLSDGRRFIATIEPMHGTTMCVYTAPASGDGLWSRTVLDDTLKNGHAVAVGDVLGTGSDRVVIGWRGMNPRGVPGVRLFTPLDKDGKQWHMTPLSGAEVAVEDLKLTDLDGDGKLDVILAGRQTKNLRILFNKR